MVQTIPCIWVYLKRFKWSPAFSKLFSIRKEFFPLLLIYNIGKLLFGIIILFDLTLSREIQAIGKPINMEPEWPVFGVLFFCNQRKINTRLARITMPRN